MAYLIRRDPFREMMTMRNAMDRWFDNAFFGAPFEAGAFTEELPLDVAETEDEFIVKASLPGINPDDLDITFTDNVLTIKGETKAEEEKDEGAYHLRERRYGSFSRSISLGSHITAKSDRSHVVL